MTTPGTVAIIGFGVNNRPLLPYWQARGMRVVVADRKPLEKLRMEVAESGRAATLYGGEHYLEDLMTHERPTEVYVTPGMVKDRPELLELSKRGARLTSETDLFLSRSPAPVLGITGSAGKTTTTTLIGLVLEKSGVEVVVGGNIGRSLLPLLDQPDAPNWAVMELSSFQLDLVEHSPHGAVWLNLSPNHLDIHGSMEAYARAKRHIVEFQQPGDWVVLPFRDQAVLEAVQSYGGARYFVDLDGAVPRGAYLADGQVWWRPEANVAPVAVMPASTIRLRGRHMLYNWLAAVAASMLAGGQIQAVREVAETFQGVPHRLEVVSRVAGITYINDSIATAPERTLAALEAVEEPLVLIAGGYDKHLDYVAFGAQLAASNVRAVVLIGQTAVKIAAALSKAGAKFPVVEVENLEAAVRRARDFARVGDTVLLSPASASYDMFVNFEERGQRFREIVGNL